MNRAFYFGVTMMKSIPEFPGYLATDSGDIYSVRPYNSWQPMLDVPRKLKPGRVGYPPTQYRSVMLRKNGTYKSRTVAYLVLSTFTGPRPEGMVVCHGPKGTLVDCVDNLTWGTQKKNNSIDKLRDGKDNRGVKHGMHKLNDIQIRIIRRAYGPRGQNGLSQQALADIFGVGQQTICHILDGSTWSHVKSGYLLPEELHSDS